MADNNVNGIQISLEKKPAAILLAALSYAVSNVDDLNEALDTHIHEHDLVDLNNLISFVALSNGWDLAADSPLK
jgi:hypothetical protein